MSAQSFTEVAEFYDELMKPVPYRMWVSYYLLLLAMQEIKPKTMLDMCCGTGTMSEFMHREGFVLEGFDLSEPMIRRAREKAEQKHYPIRYEVANAINVDMGKTYDSVFCFFDSLNNITDPNDLQKAFLSAAKHLESGQSFIFDMNMAYAFEAGMFTQQDLNKTSKIRYRWRGNWDSDTRLIHVAMKFWVGEHIFEELHVQRAYEIDDVMDMLATAGFGNIRVFHSYTLDPPRAKSDRVHFAVIKK
jgi:SAM-dependent methyltransferase